jgi:hypothetical protein
MNRKDHIIIKEHSVIEILVPEEQNQCSIHAGELFARALQMRFDLSISIARPLSELRVETPALRIWLCTSQTAPMDLQEWAEPPVKIFDVPEYEERFAIRTLMNEPIPAVLIVCGSEKAASAALGTLLFYLNIRENEIVIGEINRDSQPLTPIRGHFFANTSDSYSYFNFTLEQWRNLLDDYVLWGNNTFGWIPVHFPEWSGMSPFAEPPVFPSPEWKTIWRAHWTFQMSIYHYLKEHRLKKLIWIPVETAFPAEIPETLTSTRRGFLNMEEEDAWELSCRQRIQLLRNIGSFDFLWISSHASILRPFGQPAMTAEEFYRYIQRFTRQLQDEETQPEVWLDFSGFDEEELDELLDLLIDEKKPFVHVAVSGPGIVPFYMIKTDLPFSMQLVTMTHLTQSIRSSNSAHHLNTLQSFILGESTPAVLPIHLVNIYYELAPVTYGALGVSLGAQDEVQRFIWSRLSWAPNLTIEEILEGYGRWYFGADAAVYIRDALLELENAWNGESGLTPEKSHMALRRIEQAERHIPAKMRDLAMSRLILLKLRAYLDLAVTEKIALDNRVLKRLVDVVENNLHISDAHLRLKMAWEAIEDSPESRTFNDLVDKLSLLQQELFKATNIHIPAIERLLEPSPDRNWFAVQIHQGLHCRDTAEKNEQLERIRENLRRFWDKTILFIDCGNPQSDEFCLSGMEYLLEMPNRQWLSSWWMLTLSENEDDSVEYSIPVNPDCNYKLMVTYNTNQNLHLIQSLYSRDHLVHDTLEVKPNTPETHSYNLDPELYKDGTLQLSWIPEIGFRAGVAEILLIPELEYQP